MSVFIGLGRYLMLRIAKEWLSLKELAVVDTSLCNQKTRNIFLSFLQSTIFDGILDPKCISCLAWMNTRDIGVNSLILDMKNSDFSESLSKNVKVCENIRKVYVSLRDESTTHEILTKLTHLEEIVISNPLSKSDDQIVVPVILSCPPVLRRIDLSHLQTITDTTLQAIAIYCTSLQSINLSHCINITDDAMVLLTMSCHDLHSINLSHIVSNISDVTILSISFECRFLTTLNIAYCRAITDSCFKTLLELCTHLSDLNICGCEFLLTDETLHLIAVNCQHITRLDISRAVDTITDDSITDVGVYCLCDENATCSQTLTYVNLSYNGYITTECVAKVSHGLVALKTIELNGNAHIDMKQAKSILGYKLKTVFTETPPTFDYYNYNDEDDNEGEDEDRIDDIYSVEDEGDILDINSEGVDTDSD